MKRPEFVLIGEDRFKISTIKRYKQNGDKIKLWFNSSRFKVEYLEITLQSEEDAHAVLDNLDFYLL